MKRVSQAGFGIQKAIAVLCTTGLLASTTLAQANPALPSAPAAPQQSAPQTIAQQAQALAQPQPQPVADQGPFHIELPHSHNPLAPYMPSTVPELNLQNSQRLYDLIQDGKLRISLRDAIALALENNLTLAAFRYNFPIARADLLRTKAGGVANGVNTSVVSTTPSGFGASGGGGGSAASSATAGNGGLVTSTLGAGAAVPPFDPLLIFSGYVQHTVTPETNLSQVGVELYKVNNIEVQSQYQQPLFRSQSRTEFQFHALPSTAAAVRIRSCQQRALHPHRQKKPADHRSRLSAAGHRHRHRHREPLLGSGQRLSGRAGEVPVIGIRESDPDRRSETVGAAEHPCDAGHEGPVCGCHQRG
jgi:hypothetical protein